MKQSCIHGALCAVIFFITSHPCQAALIGVLPATSGGSDWQAYYDNVANLTWLADANHARTSGYDVDGYMTWSEANAWAASLAIGNVSGWRLPSSLNPDGSGPCSGQNCTGSEMGNMYYNVLGNDTTSGLANTGPFTNLEPAIYWSSTAYASDPNSGWRFYFNSGNQDPGGGSLYAWALQSGNAGEFDSPSPVPVPSALWLLVSGLIGLVGLARRERRPTVF